VVGAGAVAGGFGLEVAEERSSQGHGVDHDWFVRLGVEYDDLE
jgi:hypothetical protein